MGRDTVWEENGRSSVEVQSCLKSKARGSSAQMTELDRELRNEWATSTRVTGGIWDFSDQEWIVACLLYSQSRQT